VRIFLCNFAHETAGAARTRSSLRPLFSEGQGFWQTSGDQRRENAEACATPTIVIPGRAKRELDVQLHI